MPTTAVVYHLIHVTTPHQFIPKLVIDNVPDEATKSELTELCDLAGYNFSEFNIPWANHDIAPNVTPQNSNPDLIRRLRAHNCRRISYQDLQTEANADI